jgi:hypothetical protein
MQPIRSAPLALEASGDFASCAANYEIRAKAAENLKTQAIFYTGAGECAEGM